MAMSKQAESLEALSRLGITVTNEAVTKCQIHGRCSTSTDGKIIIDVEDSSAARHYEIPRTSLEIGGIDSNLLGMVIVDALIIERTLKCSCEIEWGLAGNELVISDVKRREQPSGQRTLSVNEFLRMVDPSMRNAMVAFAFSTDREFNGFTMDTLEHVLHFEPISLECAAEIAQKQSKQPDSVCAYKETIVNTCYFGLVSQLPDDGSLAVRLLEFAVQRFGIKYEDLIEYARARIESIYLKIMQDPEAHEKMFLDRDMVLLRGGQESSIRPPREVQFNCRERIIADFFTCLYKIKQFRSFYHDMLIMQNGMRAFERLPNEIRESARDTGKFLENLGLEKYREFQPTTEIPTRKKTNLDHPISGVVGREIIVAVDIPPETALQIYAVKCIISKEGGMLTHAEIISREFGVPFLAGVGEIAEDLKRGDELEIYPFDDFIEIRNNRSEKVFKFKLR